MQAKNRAKRLAARIVAGLLALLFLLMLVPFVRAEGTDETVYPAPSVTSNAALVYNLQYDKVLFAQNDSAPIYPASFAKVMTALLCYEHRQTLGTSVKITVTEEDDLTVNGLGLVVDEELDFDTLLSAMVVGSSNDAAMVLARKVGGTVADFVNRMNEKAAELGCENTHFANPTGLHNGSAQTTLSDVAKICKAAYSINDYMQTSSLLRFEIPATNKNEKVRVVTNSNLLLNPRTDLGYYVKDAMGINHGYTPQSGYCVASVRDTKGAINLVLVSGGYKNEAKQNGALLDAMSLFSYAEKAFEITTVLKRESVMREVPVRLSDTQDHVLLIAGSDVSALLPVGFNRVTDIEERLFLTEEVLEAPIVEGTSYGSVEIYFKGELVGSAELLAQRSLARSTSLALLNSVEEFLRLPVVRLILIILACVVAAFLVLCCILLAVQNRKKSGLTPQQRRAKKKLEKELLWKEKVRQQEYFRVRRKERKIRRDEAIEDFRRARERHLKAQEEALRRAEQRAKTAQRPSQRPAPQNRTTANTANNPRPAAGCETRPVQKAARPPQATLQNARQPVQSTAKNAQRPVQNTRLQAPQNAKRPPRPKE
ncbi:MAG: serine hydrolase [Clostridia bacterium]|nr:serine hydrolase [Clostridia bacterium]